MFGTESFSGSIQAVATVGLVLLEAIVLYLGYGALGRVVGSAALDTLRGE